MLAAGAASAHGEDHLKELAKTREAARAATVVTSGNTELLGTTLVPNAISGAFSHSTKHFYVSSLHAITVLDIANPRQPVVAGVLQSEMFENEAMNYGERRRADGKLEQFVLIGLDTHQASTTDPDHVNLLGPYELIVVDVSNPANPRIRGRVQVPNSTHTVACIRQTSCRYAYTAGGTQAKDLRRFSVIDLANLDAPKVVGSFGSPALGRNPQAGFAAGHKWNFDETGHGFHTGSGGTAVFDVSRPGQPRLLTKTSSTGTAPGWNDFIHHNSAHPRANAFRASTAPSLSNGNVLLVTEEDYEQVDCTRAGSFQTWHIPSFSRPLFALDKVELADLGGPADGVTPVGAFCSSHWFDFHPKGITAVAYYGGGLRLVDVRKPRDIRAYGHAFTPGSEIWDAYWAPQRNAKGQALAGKTNLVYTVDFNRGVDVYRVDLPGSTAAAQASTVPTGLTRPGSGIGAGPRAAVG